MCELLYEDFEDYGEDADRVQEIQRMSLAAAAAHRAEYDSKPHYFATRNMEADYHDDTPPVEEIVEIEVASEAIAKLATHLAKNDNISLLTAVDLACDLILVCDCVWRD